MSASFTGMEESKIIYREFSSEREINACVALQKEIFNLSDVDVVPGIILHMIARKDPPMGYLFGAFKESQGNSELIGFSISFSVHEPNAIYTIATGMRKEYQNGVYGYKLIVNSRQTILKDGIKYVYTLYDPLETHLARLYMVRLGFIGVEFKESAYNLSESESKDTIIPNDKILVLWDPGSEITENKIMGKYPQPGIRECLDLYPIINKNNLSNEDRIMIEIPENYSSLVKSEPKKALELRLEMREIFNKYLNEEDYEIIDCVSGKINRKRRTFYLLEKR